MGLSLGSLSFSFSHLAAILQDLLIHSTDVYSILAIVLSEGFQDESGSSQASPSTGKR